MSFTSADIDKLTDAQKDALGRIAINEDKGINPKVANTLIQLGYVESFEEKLRGFPPVVITRYRVPLHAHMAWCKWCAEQPENVIPEESDESLEG